MELRGMYFSLNLFLPNELSVNIYKRFARDTAVYGIASVLPRVVNVLLVGLHTKVLMPEAYSVNTKFYVLIAFFNVLFTYGMETAFFRFFTLYEKDLKVLRTAFTTLLISGVLFVLLLFGLRSPLIDLMDVDERIYLIFISILFLDTLTVIPYAYLRVMHRPLRFAFYRIFNVSVYALFNLIFLLWIPLWVREGSPVYKWYVSQPKVYYIFIANLIASFTTFLLFLPLIFRFKLGIDRGLWTKMLRYGLPVMLAGIFYIINENFDKLALDYIAGSDIMGAYAAIYKIGVFMVLYITAFRLGAEPFYFNQHKEKDAKTQYANVMLLFVIAGTVLLLGVIAFLPWIVRIFIKRPEYLVALDIVPVILTAYLFLGIYFNLSVWYKLTDRTRYGMIFSAIGALITVLFNIYMIPRIGFMASAWATLAAYSVMALLSYFFGRKHYRIPYPTGKILFYLLIATALSFWMYEKWADNWGVKLAILVGYILLVAGMEGRSLREVLKNK